MLWERLTQGNTEVEQPIQLEDGVGMEGILEEPHCGLIYILKLLLKCGLWTTSISITSVTYGNTNSWPSLQNQKICIGVQQSFLISPTVDSTEHWEIGVLKNEFSEVSLVKGEECIPGRGGCCEPKLRERK